MSYQMVVQVVLTRMADPLRQTDTHFNVRTHTQKAKEDNL